MDQQHRRGRNLVRHAQGAGDRAAIDGIDLDEAGFGGGGGGQPRVGEHGRQWQAGQPLDDGTARDHSNLPAILGFR